MHIHQYPEMSGVLNYRLRGRRPQWTKGSLFFSLFFWRTREKRVSTRFCNPSSKLFFRFSFYFGSLFLCLFFWTHGEKRFLFCSKQRFSTKVFIKEGLRPRRGSMNKSLCNPWTKGFSSFHFIFGSLFLCLFFLNTWREILLLCSKQGFWTKVLNKGFEQRFWTKVLNKGFEQRFWTKVYATHQVNCFSDFHFILVLYFYVCFFWTHGEKPFFFVEKQGFEQRRAFGPEGAQWTNVYATHYPNFFQIFILFWFSIFMFVFFEHMERNHSLLKNKGFEQGFL